MSIGERVDSLTRTNQNKKDTKTGIIEKSKFRTNNIKTGSTERKHSGSQTYDGPAFPHKIDDYDVKPFLGTKNDFNLEIKKKTSSLEDPLIRIQQMTGLKAFTKSRSISTKIEVHTQESQHLTAITPMPKTSSEYQSIESVYIPFL
jgi:hypothetical protein